MRAQVSLIPTESKKLIAKAVARMDEVQNALKKGIVAIHPSSSTIFIYEELAGKPPDTEVWVSGIVAPKAACGSAEMAKSVRSRSEGVRVPKSEFPHTWVFEKGEAKTGIPLREILDRMGPESVYMKGVNAVDPYNAVGILTGDRVEEGGTIGLVAGRAKRQGFKMIFPVGLEKLIPIPMKQAAQEAAFRKSIDYSMGAPCTLFACEGIVVTEPRAIEILTGATAVPISAGGLGGAEGAITMIIKGDDVQVSKAIEYVEGVKGARLPRDVRVRSCIECDRELCSLRGGVKRWSKATAVSQ